MSQKIHELIAIEKDAKKAFDDSLSATEAILQSSGMFSETTKSYAAIKDDDNTEKPDVEHRPLQKTVKEVLRDLAKNATKTINISLQKEEANTRAKADLVVTDKDDKEHTLGKGIPVTTLVQLEGHLGKVRDKILGIPVLDPSIEWENNDKSVDGTWKSKTAKRTTKTKKVYTPVHLAKATKEHKEQVQLVNEDTVIGHFSTSYVSGAFSPAKRKEMIEAIDAVISGVKMARSRANSTDIDKGLLLGKAIFDFIK